MPPKKDQANEVDERSNIKEANGLKETEEDVETENQDDDAHDSSEPEAYDDQQEVAEEARAGQKRKDPPTSRDKGSSKKKKEEEEASQATNSDPSTKQLLNFLLSADALPYCFPDDELEAAAKNTKGLKSYSRTSPTSFTAFEHLVCAHLLSKPLSHALGMRSIRTLLNEPYNFSTAESIVDAGEDRVWQALEDARTQHRQKTARYLFAMAQEYADDNGGDTMLGLAERANDEGPSGVIAYIKDTVPGLGDVGGQIFCRRIQCVDGWGDALWPYADTKTLQSLQEIGIDVENADDFQSTLESLVDWQRVGDMGLQERDLSRGELTAEEMETQVQAEFVVALERAVGCVLEGKVNELRKAAAMAS
ncbi:hypothetical protein PV08_11807 [Exophiala spinifera]|uniref:Uncharacterized protein n=1 Tax=Exophiala spinifera TaxID=91928 RepID=A0A0D1Y549_9EURO|nr:uncharacterized protein PV08_11807 [Exophiala spinifera]KIW10031.1 hypothetical protein PV08_11807 [Exophiala spinifera]